MKILGIPKKIFLFFYIFFALVQIFEGLCLSLFNDLYFFIKIHVLVVLPPFLYYFFTQLDQTQRKKIAFVFVLFLLAFCGYEIYLTESLQALSLQLHWPSRKFRVQAGVLFFVFYCMILTCKLPTLLIRLINSLFISIFLLPLILYCSFDLIKMITVSISIKNKTTCIEKIFCEPLIFHAFLMTGLRFLFVYICSFVIFLSWPVIRFLPTSRKFFLWILLPVSFNLVFIFVEQIPFIPLNSDSLAYSKLASSRENPLLNRDYIVRDQKQKGLYFLIVGESHDYKRSFSLAKKYHSFFRKVQNDNDYIVFHHARSFGNSVSLGYCGVSQFNLSHMLSNSTEKQNVWYLYENPDILDVMQKCKIKTLWYANLGPYQHFADILLSFSARCDCEIITDDLSFKGKYKDLGFQVDNEIPAKINRLYDENIICKDRSFMLIKPLGPHDRQMIVPDAFIERYNKLSGHDRAILYYEGVLERIFSTLKTFPETKAIVYVSDHSFSHDEQDKIVMFVWLSKELRKTRPELKAKLQEMAAKPYQHAKMYYLLLDIMNISVSKRNSVQ